MVAFGLLLVSPGQAQSYEVSDPRPELSGNTIFIRYDILNSTSEDEFSVRLSVQGENGELIPARALSGDVGPKVAGGMGKLIRWDLSQDKIEMDARIVFKVHAVYIAPPPPPVVLPIVKEVVEDSPPEEPVEEPVEELVNEQPVDQPDAQPDDQSGDQVEDQAEPTVVDNAPPEFNRAGIILQSMVFPGLGLSRVKGKPHWLKGVMAYGCLAGSVAMNRVALATYEDIYGESDVSQRESLYQKSLSQDQTSEILAYAAVAFWITDFVWTLVGTAPSKSGLSFHGTVDPVSSVPMLAISYKF